MGSIAEQGYELVQMVPPAEDYLRLRIVSGLSPKSPEGAALGLPNTLFGAVVRKDGRIVGMGRLIGDGGLHFQVVDIAVEPEHQGRGLGKAIVGSIVDHIRKALPSRAYISMIADGEAHRLYAQFGFEPTAPASIGMAMRVP